MEINQMINEIKCHPESGKIGMIACHLGQVRNTSRNGRKVTGIEVYYDHKSLEDIISDIKLLPGIIEVLVDIHEGYLHIGDDIMKVVIAGDIRENVFHALSAAVNRIKSEASRKKEFFVG